MTDSLPADSHIWFASLSGCFAGELQIETRLRHVLRGDMSIKKSGYTAEESSFL